MKLRRLKRSLFESGERIREYRGVRAVRRTGLWFVDIPRTSSSSIRAELGRRFGPAYGKQNVIEREYAQEQIFKDHEPACRMRDLLGSVTWGKLYTFTFVRNPFDRVQSLYHYRRTRQSIPTGWSFPEYVKRLVEADEKTEHFRFHGFRYGASDFVLGDDGTVLVDEIFRFEDRQNALQKLSEKTGIADFGLLHIQSASPLDRSYREIYDDRTRELVAKRYGTDLSLFDYAF